MITDKNHAELKAGDLVSLKCLVLGGYDGNGYAVVMLEPAEDVGGSVHTRTFGVNSRQVELLVSAPSAEPAKQPDIAVEPEVIEENPEEG